MSIVNLLKGVIMLNLVLHSLAAVTVKDLQEESCSRVSSCSSCISKSYCEWCVTKSKCTKKSCGNDNIIYPEFVPALLSGSKYCPQIVEPEEVLTVSSGKNTSIVVKITQIHLYMAFTPWKCKIETNGVAVTVDAVLVGDSVMCNAVLLTNESNDPYVNGSVLVMWDTIKSFDGSLTFKVCRCDLDASCSVCKK